MMARTNRHNEPPRWLLRHFFEPTGNPPLYLRRTAAVVGSLARLLGAAIIDPLLVEQLADAATRREVR